MVVKYTAKSYAPRGGHKSGSFGQEKVLSVTFSFSEYIKMKSVSIETGIPIKHLLAKCFTQVYGMPTVEEIASVSGLSIEEVKAQLAAEAERRSKTSKSVEPTTDSRPIMNPVATKLFRLKN